MNKEEFITSIKEFNGIEVNDGETIGLKITNDIDKIDDVLNLITQYEEDNTLILNIKGLSVEKLKEIFRYSFENPSIKDPIICLNIINLIKSYNTLDDSFFENQKICVSSIEDFLDLKLCLKEYIKKFIKQFSIYFLSIIKSVGKVSFLPSDEFIDIPRLYDILFMSLDFQTICIIFSKSGSFDTSECKYVRDNMKYTDSFLIKNELSRFLMDTFYADKEKK